MAKNGTRAAGDELAQGTPVEPASPVVGDLVRDESGRYGLLVDAGVLWLGTPAAHELPLHVVELRAG